MKQKLSLQILYILVSFLITSCANVVTPTGGEKDLTPPEPELFIPENYSVNFTGNSIAIKFKDYIQLNDVFNQILISPPVDELPDFKLKGKTLNIEFKSELKDSTTYTINFGQSIKDITEGNVLENFTYVFSTGNELDSLSVTGTITNLFTNTIPQSVYAILYLNGNDSSVLKEKPYYFAKANTAGVFTINNIKEGTYKLYALEDQNFNYYYDLPNETIAFQTEPLRIDTAIQNQKLKLFSEDKLPQSIAELKSISYGVTRIVFSKPAQKVNIQYTGADPENGMFIRNSNNDTLLFWHSNYKLESHSFHISYDDIDTIREVKTKSYPADSIFQKQKNAFTVIIPKAPPGGRSLINPKQPLVIQFNHPIQTIDSAKIQIMQDSNLLITPEYLIDSMDARKLIIKYNWKEDTPYNLYIQQQATTDLFGLYNDSLTVKLKIKKATDYGTLNAIVNYKKANNIIVQLLSSDQKTIVEERYLFADEFVNETNSLLFNHLNPGIYKIKIIVDADGNKQWTTGNLVQNKLPEAVYFFPVDQTIRANWETEIEWLIE